MTDDVWINFDRGMGQDREHVQATIYFPLGVSLELWSDEPRGERIWELEQVDLYPGDDVAKGPIPLKPPRITKIASGQLIDYVRREWDREVARETAHQAAQRGQESLGV